MSDKFLDHVSDTLAEIEAEGLYKRERQIAGQQQGRIEISDAKGSKRPILNLCANNYLGLANHRDIIAAGKQALDEYGFGMASVRFICGTQTQHRVLERAIADYLGKDDSILFAACFDANGSVFETLLTDQDAVISDSLNHASIIDGIRLCKAKRYRFANGDMNALEDQLRQADSDGVRFKLIVTDGVFSMDGYVADLKSICALADRYDALVMVDDCHATGHLGEEGKGTPTLTGAGDRVDIISGTLGKTLGGALGGFIAAKQPIIDLLRQRARAYLFSNSLPPAAVAGAIKAIEIAKAADERREKLSRNTQRFRDGLESAGFELLKGTTPIVPVMLGDAKLAQSMAAELDRRGVYVAGFFFPVVPKGKARIRTQLSAILEDEDIDFAIDAFREAGKATGAL